MKLNVLLCASRRGQASVLSILSMGWIITGVYRHIQRIPGTVSLRPLLLHKRHLDMILLHGRDVGADDVTPNDGL